MNACVSINDNVEHALCQVADDNDRKISFGKFGKSFYVNEAFTMKSFRLVRSSHLKLLLWDVQLTISRCVNT